MAKRGKGGRVERRSVKGLLTLLAAFLVFGGPTYLMSALQGVGVPYPLLILVGVVSFLVGLFLFVRLIGEEG